MRPTLLLVLFLAACGWKHKIKDLDNEEFDHYYALKVFMEEPQQKAYLKLKTREERDAMLKGIKYGNDKSLWDTFYQYPPHIREKIVGGLVQVGWTRDMVYMAWGTPYDRRRLTGRPASRSELLEYRFEQQADGGVLVWQPGSKTEYKAVRLFQKDVIIDDDVVTEMTDKEKSW